MDLVDAGGREPGAEPCPRARQSTEARGGEAARCARMREHLQEAGMAHSMSVTVVASEGDGKQTADIKLRCLPPGNTF